MTEEHQHHEQAHDDCEQCQHEGHEHNHVEHDMHHDHHMEHDSHMDHSQHDHASMMASPSAAADFLRRFWIVTVLLIPLLLLTPTGLNILGIADFALRPYWQFGVASIIFYFSQVFFQHAKHEIKMHQYGMMTLVSIAVGAGYLFSAASTFLPTLNAEFYIEISTLVWILLFGHYLEAKSSTAAGDVLDEVAKLLPKQAHLLVKGQEQAVDIDQLKMGDVVLVKPGEKVPADGVITKGEANFNEALISGESKPVLKEKDNQVIAGAICLDGSVQVKLDKVGEHSTIGQIKQLIAQAKNTKPTAQSIADKAAGVLTFTALSVALLTILIWSLVLGQPLAFSLTMAMTVLVIACPHALGLAIPTVSTIATTLAVKNGLFVKDLQKLEVVKDIDYVVFDKTGTLTKGEFGVTEIIPLNQSQKNLLQIAASLETHSAHVIAQSIVARAKTEKLALMKITNFKDLAGKGISGTIKGNTYYIGNPTLMKELKVWTKAADKLAQQHSQAGNTVVALADKKEVLGLIVLADQIKPTAKIAIAKLHQLDLKTAMITGDNESVASAVAKELAIDTYFANVLPDNKYKHIKELQNSGNKVLMVGDGVNDAPALTQANAGVAIGAGTEVAVEAGDIVLTNNNPQDIAVLIILARKVYRKMMENLWWALGYNILAIPAAAGVFLPWGFRLRPEIGALLMSLSSVIVVINALSLKKSHLKMA